jgi:hypothetical protein
MVAQIVEADGRTPAAHLPNKSNIPRRKIILSGRHGACNQTSERRTATNCASFRAKTGSFECYWTTVDALALM